MIRWAPILAALLLAGCANPRPAADTQVPPFARVPFEPFSRTAVVAIALREWRLFGGPVDDDAPGSRPSPEPDDKPERQQGLWQRVGEYWWLGLPEGAPEAGWTGKHDAAGRKFPASQDEDFAWSAAFVSYVMRMAGAGAGFPYAAAHYAYIDAAYEGAVGPSKWSIVAEPPDVYAPVQGDLICASRGARGIRFGDLPGRFPAHCDIVVAAAPGQLDAIGGNVDDAVTLTHVPVTPDGRLADADGKVVDERYPWFVVVRVLYEQ